jgi:uncharacterized damage-inducible protein DinB
MKTDIERVGEQLTQVQEGEAWHGPSVREVLAGVDAVNAAARPLRGAHSIWEIVHHVRVTEEGVRAQLTGERAPEEPEWPSLIDTGDAAWRAAVARLEGTQRALREAVRRLPEERLHEPVPGKSHSYWHELLGLMHHDVYHAGQIALLKRGL